MNFTFSSRAAKDSRDALEELLFFNPRQHRVREGIRNSLEAFGHPKLVETPDGWTVRIEGQEAQTLFAYDRSRTRSAPVGVVVFLRTSAAEIAILHIAVHPDYALDGQRPGQGLGVVLMDKVREIGRRIAGVHRVVFFYRREVVLKL